ncbi:MAG: Hpt domain-containing protein [Oscillospiraceae bacterium]|nr:Hpt domain-containing protein [Oscillospiraceae bacterium]
MEMTNEEKLLAVRQIDELDVDAGLRTISNLVGAYLKVLGILVKMNINDEGKFEALLAENDYEAFRTLIHGYKGALANIGASELADKARVLEVAAIDNDRSVIDEKLNEFKDGVTALAIKLKDILGEPQN